MQYSDIWSKIASFYQLIRSKILWFLTFGNNGSAGMLAMPATILMSVCAYNILFVTCFQYVFRWSIHVLQYMYRTRKTRHSPGIFKTLWTGRGALCSDMTLHLVVVYINFWSLTMHIGVRLITLILVQGVKNAPQFLRNSSGYKHARKLEHNSLERWDP